MLDFILRYLGIFVSGFCIGYNQRFGFQSAFLSVIATLAIMLSCLYYYHKGSRDEEL